MNKTLIEALKCIIKGSISLKTKTTTEYGYTITHYTLKWKAIQGKTAPYLRIMAYIQQLLYKLSNKNGQKRNN